MKKIISLFQRNYDTDRLVRDEVVPGAEWVLNGEGTPTRKWDGTCCLVENGKLFKRYELKKGKQPPSGFVAAQGPDLVTGEIPGWVPVGEGNEDRWHRAALTSAPIPLTDGTYELVGPHINGNPDKFENEQLVPHGKNLVLSCPRTFEELRSFFKGADIEGIVWWRDINDPNCDKVKIKKKDFGLKR